MATPQRTPLLVCMQNSRSEDVTLEVMPGDDFRTFLDKAKKLLGFEIDIRCITQNQVSLSENIYDFLIDADPEQLNPTVVQEDPESARQLLAIHEQSETLYALEDRTQASAELHESPKFNVDKIPFVKYANVEPKHVLSTSPDVIKTVTITKSPSKAQDVGNLPFRSVSEYSYEYRNFARRQNAKMQKRLSNLQCANYPFGFGASRLTRDEVLNVLKDSPVVKTIEFIEESEKHVRKTDPYKLSKKPSERVNVAISVRRDETGNYCFVCDTLIQNHFDEIYLFDSEDQKAYRSSPKREQATPLKVICNMCLSIYFAYSLELLTEKTLELDEYLIIRRNQQYLYKRILPLPQRIVEEVVNEVDRAEPQIIMNRDIDEKATVIEKESNAKTELSGLNENKGVKASIKVDAKIDDRQEVKIVTEKETEKKSKTYDFEVEVLEDADDCVVVEEELKCRFCSKTFSNVDEAVEHGTEHWLAKEKVFPCPLCEYGYQTFVWLRGHMYSKHRPGNDPKAPGRQLATPTPSSISSLCNSDDQSQTQSPVANRTRNSVNRKRPAFSKKKDKSVKKTKQAKKLENKSKKNPTSDANHSENTANMIILSREGTDVRKEADDDLWIVETGNSNANPKEYRKNKIYPCPACKKKFISSETLEIHVSRKCKAPNIIVSKSTLDASAKPSKRKPIHKYETKKRVEGEADPNVMTCDDCGSTFTSKVRLKFHMQFHTPTALLTSAGRFLCERCPLDSSFGTESELFDHVHFTHEKRRRWACPVQGCDKSFFLRAMLTKHGRTHTNTRRYICSECGKRFLDKQTLDEHSVTHLKRKPFECHICQKQLTRRSRFRMHLKAHEESLTPRPLHACRLCSRAFKDLLEAKEHAANSQCGMESHESVDHIKSEEQAHFLLADSEEAKNMINELSDDMKKLITIVEVDKVLRCEYCEDVFYVAESLNEHRTLHLNVEEPFTCHICKVTFPTYSRCTTHKTTHGYYKRSLSVKSSQLDAAQEMGPSASGILGYGDFPVAKHFLCGDCGRTYLHWTYFQVHRRMKHPTGEEVYTCTDCGDVYPNSWGLAYHRRKMHSGIVKNDKENCRSKSNIRIPCRDCQEVFFNKSALYTHRRKVHFNLMPNASKHLSMFSCATCKKRYANKPGLEAHLRAAPSACAPAAAPYACARCGAAFAYCEHLATHIMESHKEDASHMCSTCGATFASRSDLAAHARSHSPPRVHACPVCARVFRSASVCSEHLRVHTGERPYPCDICGLSFRRSTARNNHRLIHTGERAFNCERCPKSFRIRSDLRAHVKTKHPERVLVMEMRGLCPEPEEVIRQLLYNNIALENVAGIAKVSFPKGSPNLVIGGDATSLEILQGAQHDSGSQLWSERVKAAITAQLPKRDASCGHGNQQAKQWRRGRGISRRDRAQPRSSQEALQLDDQADIYHVEIKDVAVEELTQLLGGVLTSDGKGLLLSSGEFLPFSAVLNEESMLSDQTQDVGDNRMQTTEEMQSIHGIFAGASSDHIPKTKAVNTQDLSPNTQAYSKYDPNFRNFANMLTSLDNPKKSCQQKSHRVGDETAQQNNLANEVQTEQNEDCPVENASDQYNMENCGKSMPILLSPREKETTFEQCQYPLENSVISQTDYYHPEVSGNQTEFPGMHEHSQPSRIPDGNGKPGQCSLDSEEYFQTRIGGEISEPNRKNLQSETSQPFLYAATSENVTDQYRKSMGNDEICQSNFISPQGSMPSEQHLYNLGIETSQPISYIPGGSRKGNPYQCTFQSNDTCQANLKTVHGSTQATMEHNSLGNSGIFQTKLRVLNWDRNNSGNYLGNNVTRPNLYTPEENYDYDYRHRNLNPNIELPDGNTTDYQKNMGSNEIPQPVLYNPPQNSEQYGYNSGNNDSSEFVYGTEERTVFHL